MRIKTHGENSTRFECSFENLLVLSVVLKIHSFRVQFSLDDFAIVMSDKFSFKKAIDPSEMPTRPEEERYNCKLGPGKTKLEKSEGEDEIYTRNE